MLRWMWCITRWIFRFELQTLRICWWFSWLTRSQITSWWCSIISTTTTSICSNHSSSSTSVLYSKVGCGFCPVFRFLLVSENQILNTNNVIVDEYGDLSYENRSLGDMMVDWLVKFTAQSWEREFNSHDELFFKYTKIYKKLEFLKIKKT